MNRLVARIRFDGSPFAVADLHPLAPEFPAAVGDGFAIAAPQLAVDRERRLQLALDGHLHDRDDFARSCGIESRPPARRNDAELLLAAFSAGGEEALKAFEGPACAVLYDGAARRLYLVRDALGERALYFRSAGSEIAVASSAGALLDLPFGSVTADERSIARFLAGDGPRRGATFFREVEELPPGTLLGWDRSGRRSAAEARPIAAPAPGAGRQADFEARFRELLDEAVARRLPAEGATAILMSGGLDSTAVAATAAQLLASRQRARPVTLSWVFDQLDGTDERRWIDAANRQSGALGRALVCDALHPLSGAPAWPGLASSPALSPYWRVYQRALEEARNSEATVLLTGEWGDQLWAGGRDWLRDLVEVGELGSALAGLAHSLLLRALARRQAHSLRSSVGRLRRRPAPPRSVEPIAWLTPYARRLISEAAAERTGADAPDRASYRLTKLSNPFDRLFYEVPDAMAAAARIEIRRPFRDRRLVEFFMGVPARFLYRPGEEKRLLRRALVDRLPPLVLRRRQATSLLALFDRGLAEEGWPLLRSTLEDSRAIWPRFIEREWLWSRAVATLRSADDGLERLVLWSCYCLERWRRFVEQNVAFTRVES